MIDENKNLKDSIKDSVRGNSSLQTGVSSMSVMFTYTKTNKLISALYMVTDVMDKEEPLRSKLRTLGTGLISDTHILSIKTQNEAKITLSFIKQKINEIVSFLDIAFAIGMVSEMNCNILKKEFFEFKNSIKESNLKDTSWLEEFMKEEESFRDDFYKGHRTLGVQKGSTLMKALSNKMLMRPLKNSLSDTKSNHSSSESFELLKKKRREEIILVIRDKNNLEPNSDGATIKDIRENNKGLLISCGEKTLQRELISMVKDGVLNKTGEKRWSRYFLPK